MSSDISIPYGWASVKLSDLGEVNRGRSRYRPRYAEHLYGGPYPFVQTGDIKASGGRISSYSQTYSEDGLKQSRLWPEGTLCITIAANIAETGILSFPACFPDSVIGFIADPEKCDVYFIEYCFRVLRKDIQRQATGSVQDNINLQTLERLRFPIPTLSEQRRIAKILCRLDEKITLNTQINQTLEQMAQALFKSWFVDFDPVIDNALDAGNPIPEPLAERAARRQAMWAAGSEKAPARLPAETRRLFPDSFEEDDALGWMPVGWNSGCINDVCKMNAKSWTATNRPHSVNYVDLASTKSGVIEEITCFDFAAAPSRARRVLSPGDTIIGTVRPGNRSYALIGEAKCQLTGSTGFAVLTPNSKELVEFVYLAVTREDVIEEFAHLADGGAYPAIKPSVIGDSKVVIPSKKILFLFNNFTTPMFVRYQNNLRENSALNNLRDTLLPKLLSGELQLPEAEAAVQTALEVESV